MNIPFQIIITGYYYRILLFNGVPMGKRDLTHDIIRNNLLFRKHINKGTYTFVAH